jgi:primosomal protein N' (replication factor Y)
MSAVKISLVAVEGVSYHFDRLYGYLVPTELEEDAQPGARVVVPFGAGNKSSRGVIVSVEYGNGSSLKQLQSVIDDTPLITGELIELAIWIKAQTFCTLYDALRLMLPAGLGLQVTKQYSINPLMPPDAFGLLTADEKRLCELLSKKSLTKEQLLDRMGLNGGSDMPEALAQRGLLLTEDFTKATYNEATASMARLNISEDMARGLLSGVELTKKQKSALKTVIEADSATVKEICYFSGVTVSVINALVKKGILELAQLRIMRNPYRDILSAREEPPQLSDTQQAAYDNLLPLYEKHAAAAALIFGITGSGKTQVFMKLIERVRVDGKGVIVLVPEIALTPQAVSRFYARFGGDIAVLHSGLSVGERLDEWQRIREGAASIVVGTRSAVFAPVIDLGLIIIDEEQEHTYKSESSPRYHARDIARFRCAKGGSLMVVASATPSVESFYAAAVGRYSLVRLDERYGEAVLPQVITVDMKQELAAGNDGPVSERLKTELIENMKRGEQSILLLNRRGYNTFIYCTDCGHVLACPNCSISLTYHSANGRLMCHYCGYSSAGVSACPACGSRHMRYSGQGTQKAEQVLAELLPQARILRMDTDTTSSKYSHEKILKKFEEEKYDILIGTQMVAKGLDFPNVTLVGVLSADQSLYTDDFRASERTFSLLTQVIGRSGRGALRGRAVVQTSTPDNEVIRFSSDQDYDAFYGAEIKLRSALLYPPFCDLCEIGFSSAMENDVKMLAAAFFARLKEEILKVKDMPIRLMGPSPASVYKVNGRYRYRIIMKCKNDKSVRALISNLLTEFGKSGKFKKSAIFADMNPLTVI